MVRLGDGPQWAGLSLLTAPAVSVSGCGGMVDCLCVVGGLSVAIWPSGVSGIWPAWIQKSVVVPASDCEPVSTRSGQSVALMSQNRRSGVLGTRLVGVAAARRMSFDDGGRRKL